MAAVLTHGKRMLRASLKKQEEKDACSPQKRSKRVDPGKDAEWWCHVGLDKDGFSLNYISDYKDSDDDPFDLDKTYIPDASSDYVSDSIASSIQSTCINILSTYCLDMSDEISISPRYISKSEVTSDVANIHTRNKPIAPAPPCDITNTLPENITASLDINQAGMSDTVTISAVSYTPTNEVDPLSDTSTTPPSDTDSSPTSSTTSVLPCEEATIHTGIANQAASSDATSAPLSDITNMTNQADFHCVQCERRFKTKGGFSNHVKSHRKGIQAS